jgi:carbonic anhydrase
MKANSSRDIESETVWSRRSFVATALGACALSPALLAQTGLNGHGSLTKEQRDALTIPQIIEAMKKGNERFRSGKMAPRDYLAQKRSSSSGQYPAAVLLGCIDSRAPAEIVFDIGIGDAFNARVAGNVANDDMLGSMEFACAVAGAKVVFVLGHTKCGAIKGAIDDVVLGNLTGLLARIKPAIAQTKFDGEKSSKNYDYVDAVARTNVQVAISDIRRRSPVLEDLEKKGSIVITGGMYNITTGEIDYLS